MIRFKFKFKTFSKFNSERPLLSSLEDSYSNKLQTDVYDYNDESLAKVELNAKKVAGTTIIVEYEIKVTNVGEVDAYIRKIKDFILYNTNSKN